MSLIVNSCIFLESEHLSAQIKWCTNIRNTTLTSMGQKPTLTNICTSLPHKPQKNPCLLSYTASQLENSFIGVCWNYLLETAQNIPGSKPLLKTSKQTNQLTTTTNNPDKSCAFPNDLPSPIYWHNAFVQ